MCCGYSTSCVSMDMAMITDKDYGGDWILLMSLSNSGKATHSQLPPSESEGPLAGYYAIVYLVIAISAPIPLVYPLLCDIFRVSGLAVGSLLGFSKREH